MNEEYEGATSRGLPRRGRGSDDPLPVNAWAIAGLVVLALIAGMLVLGRHKAGGPGGILPVDPYAAQLPLSGFAQDDSFVAQSTTEQRLNLSIHPSRRVSVEE